MTGITGTELCKAPTPTKPGARKPEVRYAVQLWLSISNDRKGTLIATTRLQDDQEKR